MIKTIEHIIDKGAFMFDMEGNEREFQTVATILITLVVLGLVALSATN